MFFSLSTVNGSYIILDMRVKVNGQNVAVCVKEYNDARQNVAAACGLVLGACGL
tara:strand:+ start:232 stop:393 length:162 start_codon:yes stop_codon:yes gene_type:complete